MTIHLILFAHGFYCIFIRFFTNKERVTILYPPNANIMHLSLCRNLRVIVCISIGMLYIVYIFQYHINNLVHIRIIKIVCFQAIGCLKFRVSYCVKIIRLPN